MARAVLFLATVFLLFANATEAECRCDESGQRFFYTTSDPDYAVWMEEFPWEVKEVEPIYDLQQTDEPISGCRVTVELVAGDHPLIDTHDMEKHFDSILFGETWVPFIVFEENMLRQACIIPLILS